MILSVSRRTDIPACYPDWLFERLKEGYVLVRNPHNPRQIGRINISPETVDGIVFWTKNPGPMMGRLGELEKYPYYFQFTLTAYGPELERNLPSKNRVLIPLFQQLSKEIGKERVVWRYDPIFFGGSYTPEYHSRYFEVLAAKLAPYTEKCTVSFLDLYRKTERNLRGLAILPMTRELQIETVQRFAEIAKKYNIEIDACAEPLDFSKFGVPRARCIDKARLERIGHYKLKAGKDRNQRAECGCMESIDIGAYHTCVNGCLYCYANDSQEEAKRNFRRHDPAGPLLLGRIEEGDVIRERKMNSRADGQMSLFVKSDTNPPPSPSAARNP